MILHHNFSYLQNTVNYGLVEFVQEWWSPLDKNIENEKAIKIVHFVIATKYFTKDIYRYKIHSPTFTFLFYVQKAAVIFKK